MDDGPERDNNKFVVKQINLMIAVGIQMKKE
jgi:hypothetical protein